MVQSSLASARFCAQEHLDRLAGVWANQGGIGAACAYALRSGGKRIRPTIAISLGRTLLERGGRSTPSRDRALCQAAVGVELLHLASLIADDLPCMDDDDERRGLPTVHKRFSESTALLASYALIAHGYELLTFASLEAPNPVRAIEAVALIAGCGGVNGAAEGQYLDLELAAGRSADRYRMLRLKTGALFEMAFLCGWGFGGDEVAPAAAMGQLAESFGLAFQCLDDLADRQTDGSENCAKEWGCERARTHAGDQLRLFKGQLKSLGWFLGPMEELSNWMESSLSGVAQTPAVSVAAAGRSTVV